MRLQRKGRKKAPFYHIVVADARSPRDGRFIQKLGTYNPMTKPATIDLDRELAYDWLVKGAQPTETVRAILRFKGVLYKKHLMRGVNKGAMSVEEAETKYQAWIDEKESRIAARVASTAKEKADYHVKVSGAPKPVAAIVAEAAAEEAAPVAEDETAVEEPAAETPADAASEEE